MTTVEWFAKRLLSRDAPRCFRCGRKLHQGHVRRSCSDEYCACDEGHDGVHGTGFYTKDGAFVQES